MKFFKPLLILPAIIIFIAVASCDKLVTNPVPDDLEGWTVIEDGLFFKETQINTSNGEEKDIVIVKIDPRKFQFNIYQNPNKESSKNIKEVHEETSSLLTFNGSYFTEEFEPTGLLISNYTTIRETSNADLLNGILAISNKGIAYIYDSNSFRENPAIEFAIQNGPVIYKDGKSKITPDNNASSSRTIIGTDKDNNIVIIILKRNLLNPSNTISLYEMAKLIEESSQLSSLGLQSVLNLDGGSSTGLMVGDRYFAEMEKVQNIIITSKRK